MIPKTSTLLLSCIALLLTLGSCRKQQAQTYAESGLYANRQYYCDTVVHTHPLRMFTQNGEVSDPTVISRYLSLHPYMTGAPGTPGEEHPSYILSTRTRMVYLNAERSFSASLDLGGLDLRQQDTSMYGHGTPGAPIDELYNYEQSYQAMRNAVLEMYDSYIRLERVDTNNYQCFELFHTKGSYHNEAIELPYTFVASRIFQKSYPFALKASLAPQVPAGDTLLVQEGTVTFRMR